MATSAGRLYRAAMVGWQASGSPLDARPSRKDLGEASIVGLLSALTAEAGPQRTTFVIMDDQQGRAAVRALAVANIDLMGTASDCDACRGLRQQARRRGAGRSPRSRRQGLIAALTAIRFCCARECSGHRQPGVGSSGRAGSRGIGRPSLTHLLATTWFTTCAAQGHALGTLDGQRSPIGKRTTLCNSVNSGHQVPWFPPSASDAWACRTWTVRAPGRQEHRHHPCGPRCGYHPARHRRLLRHGP